MTRRNTGDLFTLMLRQIEAQSGTVTARELMRWFGEDSVVYGQQQRVNTLIANYRRAGFLEDVAERCTCCGAAKTRGIRNQPLTITDKGRAFLAQPEVQ